MLYSNIIQDHRHFFTFTFILLYAPENTTNVYNWTSSIAKKKNIIFYYNFCLVTFGKMSAILTCFSSIRNFIEPLLFQ